MKNNILSPILIWLFFFTITVLAKGQKPTMQVACNIASLEYVDLIQAHPSWMHRNGFVNDQYQFINWSGNLVDFTPKTMRLTSDGSFYPHHSPIITSDSAKIYPQFWFNLRENGTYTVIAEGKGKLSFDYFQPEHFSSASTDYSFTNGTTFTFTTTGLKNPDNTGYPATTGSGPGGNGVTMVWLQITESDSINPVKNIRVLPPDYTDAAGTVHHFIDEYASKPFHPKFIEDMQKYTVIRFMDIGNTNGSKVKHWSDIKQPNELGIKTTNYLEMIKLCNQANRDIWITVPHLATDGFVDTLATLINDNLNPSLKTYIEFSNEVWNTMFAQTAWAKEQGMLLGWTENSAMKYYARRSSEVFKRFANVYKSDRNRLVLVSAWQMGGGDGLLGDYYNDPIINPGGTKPDVFAVAPYFYKLYQPGDIGVQGECLWHSCDDCVATSVPSVQTILDDMSNSVKMDVAGGLKYAKEGADKYHIPLINYEGGSHAVGIYGAENSCELTDNLMKANRDPRMYDIYREWMDTLRSAGVEMLNQYFDCGGWSKWGAWGLEEFRGQDLASPKFKALVEWEKANPLVLDTQAPSTPGTPIEEVVTSTSITLSWTESTDNGSIIGYDIFRDGVLTGSSNCQVNNTKYIDTGLKPNTSYNYYVKARDFGGNYSSQSNSVSITTGGVDTQNPSTIINLQIVQKSYNEIKIKWSPSADNDNIEKYIISYDGLIDSTTELSFLLKNLSPSTTYKINVMAKDPSGNLSEPSFIIVKTDEYPILKAKQSYSTVTIDGNLTEASWNLPYRAKKTVSLASTLDNDSINIGVLWDANYLYIGAKAIDQILMKSVYFWDGDGFEILIDGNNNKSKTYEAGHDVKYTFLWNSGTMVGSDTIGVLHKFQNIVGGWSCEIAIPWSKLGINSPAVGLITGFNIIYDDADYNEWGRSRQYTFVGDESIYTSCEQFTSLTLSSDTVMPVAPANIVFSDITMSSAIVSWSGSSDQAGIKGYNVFVNNMQVNAELVSTTTFNIDGLLPNTKYEVSVCSMDENFNSSNKTTASFTTLAGNTIVDFNAALNTTANYSFKAMVQKNSINHFVPFSTAPNSELFGIIPEFSKQFEIKGGFNYEHNADPVINSGTPTIFRKGSGGEADGSLYIFTGEVNASNFTAILMWTKDKFLNGNDLFNNVAFDSTADSRVTLKVLANNNSTMRFIVRTASNYFISEAVFDSQNDDSGFNYFTLSNFGNNGNIGKRWAIYDPSTLKMPVENALNFAATNLSNVQEIGLIFSVGRSQWAYSFGLLELTAFGIKEVTDTQAPSMPSGIRATNVTNTSFTLNWDASSDDFGVTAYDVFEIDTISGRATLLGSTPALLFNLGGLSINNSYKYKVQARDRAGNKSELSDVFTIKILSNTSANTSAEEISIFPNPVNDYLTVEGAESPSKASIFNIDGELLIQSVISDSQQTINVSKLPSGIYIIEVSNDTKLMRSKFVKN